MATWATCALLLACSGGAAAFSSVGLRSPAVGAPRVRGSRVVAQLPAKESKRSADLGADEVPDAPEWYEFFTNTPLAISRTLARQQYEQKQNGPMELPSYWDSIWKLSFMQGSAPGTPLTFGDTAQTFKDNIEQLFGGYPSKDGAPLAAADVSDIDLKALFLGMKSYFDRYGSVFKMCFGPKSFMVVSDPVVVRHLLRENNRNYDKGQLAVVLEDIMGKGLIPADPVTWAKRRRAITPAFHRLYLERMVSEFGEANDKLIAQLRSNAKAGARIDMEERFGSLALDIIGKAVFNYDFNSVCDESPVVKAAVRALGEVEHRALVPLPYWKVPGANELVPRLRDFNRDMDLLNAKLYELINGCACRFVLTRLHVCIRGLCCGRSTLAASNRPHPPAQTPPLRHGFAQLKAV
jgi:hypothetical protein